MRVPQYVSQVSARSSTASQRISTPASAFGAQEAQGLAAVGQGLDRMRQRAVQIQEEDDAAAALEAYNGAASRLREFTHGEGGFLTRQGREAYEGLQDGVSEIERIRNEASARLNPRQRQAFDNLWRSRSESTLNSMSTHAANQRRAYIEGQAQATVARVIAEAADPEAWSNPATIREQQGVAARAITASMSGQSDEAVNLAIAQMESQSWMSAIQAAQAAGQYRVAESIFEAHQDQIVGADATRARAMIEEGGFRERGQRGADAVWDRFGEDRAAAMRHIRDNYSGRDRDEVQRRYLETANIMEQARTEQGEATFNDALGVILDGGNLDDIPPELQAALSSAQVATLDRLVSGSPLQTDWSAYDRYIAMPPENLRGVNLAQARTELADAEYRRIEGLVIGARGRQADTQELSYIRTERDIVNSGLRLAGIGSEDHQGRREFEDSIQRARESFFRAEGREPNEAELQSIVDAKTAEVVVGRTWFGGRDMGRIPTSYSETRGDYRIAVNEAFRGVSATDEDRNLYYQRAIAEYAALGVTPTPAQVARAIQFLMRQEERAQ